MVKGVIVVSFEMPDDRPDRMGEIADEFRYIFREHQDVKIYMAIRETAAEVLDIFKDLE